MIKNIKIIPPRPEIPTIKMCGGKKGKGSCGNWAGSTKGQTAIKIAA